MNSLDCSPDDGRKAYEALYADRIALQADNERLKEEGLELFDDAVDARKENERLIDLHRKAVAEAVILQEEKADRDEGIERLLEVVREISDLELDPTAPEVFSRQMKQILSQALATAAHTSGEHGDVPTRNSGEADYE